MQTTYSARGRVGAGQAGIQDSSSASTASQIHSRTGSLFVMTVVSFSYPDEFHGILHRSRRLGLGLRKHARHGLRILEGRPQQGNNRRFFFCVLISLLLLGL